MRGDGIDSWAMRGDGETQGRPLGGSGGVEQDLEAPTAHSALWLESTRACGVWRGLSELG